MARAQQLASAEGSDSTCTTHIFGALLEVYGDVMHRTLELHGASAAELQQRLDEFAEHAESR